MDIYSAEIQVNKLLNYVKNLSNSKSRMYQKSKDRLKELASMCNQVVAVIAEILQDEALVNDQQDEFGGSDIRDFDSMLISMENQLSELRQFLNVPKTTSPTSSESTVKHHVFYMYVQCLQSLVQSSFIIQEAEDCSKLLWAWFSARFCNRSSDFKYNMKRFPGWIRDIVILYAYHFENNSLNLFVDNFYQWIASISTGTNNYVVPFEIYDFNRSPKPEMVTLSAVVLWDVLLDCGLRSLCDDSSSEFFPTEDCVYSLVGMINSKIMDPYQNYLYDNSILTKCKFNLKAGDVR